MLFIFISIFFSVFLGLLKVPCPVVFRTSYVRSIYVLCLRGGNVSHFFSAWVFFHEHSRVTGLHEKGEGISLTPQYHFHALYRHFDISRAITAESSPLHIASSRNQTGNLWFLSTSH